MTQIYNLYRYNINCHDIPSNIEVTHDVWSPEILNECPHYDPNHIFQSAYIIEKIQENNLFFENDTENTGGKFACYGYEFNVPSGPETSFIDIKQISFPYNIRISCCRFSFDSVCAGDYFSAISIINIPYGITSAEVSTGNVIPLDNISITIVKLGTTIILDDGVNRQELGECIGIDINTKTVTVEKSVSNIFQSGTPVYFGFVMAQNLKISNSMLSFIIGESVVNSMVLPTSQTVYIKYKNTTSSPKNFILYVDLFR
jgi:hypothetical protein